MMRMLYVEINIIGVIMLLLLYFSYGKNYGRDLEQHYFRSLLLATIIMLILDALTWALDGRVILNNVFFNYALQFMLFFSSPFIGYLWMSYCDYRIFGDEKGLKRRSLYYAIPLILNVFILFMNNRTGWVFSLDGAGVYYRGSHFSLYILLTFSDVVAALVLSLYKSLRTKGARRKEYVYLCLFVIFPLCSAIIQIAFYGLNLVWNSIAFALLMIYINVQNRQISTDELTGLNNRRRFNRHMDTTLAEQIEDGTFALLMIDIDSFKLINDTYGHQEGDRALIKTAAILKRCCKDARCFLSRIGGDEFVITIRECGWPYVQSIINSIHERAKKENEKGETPFTLSYSVGYSILGEDNARTQDALVSLADKRMYEEKRRKKQNA